MTKLIVRQGGVHTYNKQLGWLNTEGRMATQGNFAGQAFDWITRGGIPVMVPDMFPVDNPDIADRFKPLDQGTMAIRIPDNELVYVE